MKLPRIGAALVAPVFAAALLLGADEAPRAQAQMPPPAATTAPLDTWRFEPARDTFSPDALLDLRALNEKVAGASGFVRVGADGGFVRGDGQPLRLWAVNTDVGRGAAPPAGSNAPDLARHARFLAKRGVNMVRLHRQLSPDLAAQPNAALTDINEAERDGIWRTVAAMKREGIYTTLSPYWAAALKLSNAWNIPGGAGQQAWGLLFFDATLQAGYRAWLKKLLTEKNPYTGIALAQDPALAVLQLQNEDSLLFWTVGTIKGAQREALEVLFARFAVGKHGSIDAALAAWQGDRAAADRPDTGRLALAETWELTQAGSGGHARRLADQTEFYATTMREFNRRTVEYLRNELGVRALINAGNWRTASNERLGDAERWSYGAADVDATNVYTGGLHEGPNNGWAIQDGDRFTSDSVLRKPWTLPIALRQSAGRPMLVTEGGWVAPNGYGAEGPFLIAAYASLNGVAGYYWFTNGDEGWAAPRGPNNVLPFLPKWTYNDPDVLGTFPAAALMYRRGDLRRGAVALDEVRPLQALWERQPPALTEATSFDPNRDAQRNVAAGPASGPVTASTFLRGPVRVAFGGTGAARTTLGPAGPAAPPGTIRANTGDVLMNPTQGWCRIDTPMAQGVAAHFAQTAAHEFTDVRFASGNAFGSALAVSLDDQPLARSGRVLVQYGTQSRPTGWAQAPARIERPGQPAIDGMVIRATGQGPWQVERARLEVTIRNPALTTATVLDMNGMPAGTVPLTRSDKQVAFRFPAEAMYVVLR
ncbi:MAG TPA: hypothetical protein VNU71_02510 [Burkholderiaceae bacterium]|nr:hypothetical protein [Burkholderiaceae bacterium]